MLVEPDADFYINYKYKRQALESYFLEITNHCNLACPHCYQEPDNKSADPSIDYLLSLIDSWPDDGYPVALVGAEPTTRKDLPDLIRAINNMNRKHRKVMILTNGVYLSNYEYAQKFEECSPSRFEIHIESACIGYDLTLVGYETRQPSEFSNNVLEWPEFLYCPGWI